MKKTILFLLLAVITNSCGNRHAAEAYDDLAMVDMVEMEPAYEEAIPPEQLSRGGGLPVTEPQADQRAEVKVIRNGRMGVKVADISRAKKHADTVVAACKGYYSKEKFNDGDYSSEFELTVRVPQQNYDSFIAGIESGPGEILYKEIDVLDVTEQFVDLETRLGNKRSYLERYRELLKRASTVKEVLEVEQQVRMLEEEIESVEGRLRYLGDQVSYSTLNLTLTQEKEYAHGSDGHEDVLPRLKKSLFAGWRGTVDVFVFIVGLWPLWIAAAAAIILLRRAGSNRRKK